MPLNFPPQIYPKQKDAEFDAEGRPYNPFFYTATPQTTNLLHDIATHVEQGSNSMGYQNSMQYLLTSLVFIGHLVKLSTDVPAYSNAPYSDNLATVTLLSGPESVTVTGDVCRKVNTCLIGYSDTLGTRAVGLSQLTRVS